MLIKTQNSNLKVHIKFKTQKFRVWDLKFDTYLNFELWYLKFSAVDRV